MDFEALRELQKKKAELVIQFRNGVRDLCEGIDLAIETKPGLAQLKTIPPNGPAHNHRQTVFQNILFFTTRLGSGSTSTPTTLTWTGENTATFLAPSSCMTMPS